MSDRTDRARQFMPFSPLKGYDDLVKDKEKIISPKRELSEYRAGMLSEKLIQVKKGMVIKIVYYQGDGYIKTEGMVSAIDFTTRQLTVIKNKISFDDIYDISSKDICVNELFE
ncbi:MAG: YolD-like family protein [Clostridia bacterium]|nr:YolD-like family protein [Clostridia bacterium]